MKNTKRLFAFILCLVFAFAACPAAYAYGEIKGARLESGYNYSFDLPEGIKSFTIGAYVCDEPSSNGGYHYESVNISEGNGYTVSGGRAVVDPEVVKEAVSKELQYFSAKGDVPMVVWAYGYSEEAGSFDSDEIKITVNTDTLNYKMGKDPNASYTVINPDPYEEEPDGFFAKLFQSIKSFFASIINFFRSIFTGRVPY